MPLPKPTRPTRPLDNPELIPQPSEVTRTYSQLRPSDIFEYRPSYDITAYELSELIAIFFNGITLHFQRYSTLPDELKRHFKHKKSA